MNVGKTLFAQVMEFVPWKTFGRIVERHKGRRGHVHLGLRRLVSRHGPFAQLTGPSRCATLRFSWLPIKRSSFT